MEGYDLLKEELKKEILEILKEEGNLKAPKNSYSASSTIKGIIQPSIDHLKSNEQHQVHSAYSMLIRSTFGIRSIANLNSEILPDAIEFTKGVLNLVKKYSSKLEK
ncbi:hypothetical protein [Paenibacillus elgii]|uniref:hypothetical protein n=1 Tax=Paenibacillus elgii TaxID=189691 RepID=UPI000248C95E|nr:hypothetical protein [Paenibacillus elgii]